MSEFAKALLLNPTVFIALLLALMASLFISWFVFLDEDSTVLVAETPQHKQSEAISAVIGRRDPFSAMIGQRDPFSVSHVVEESPQKISDPKNQTTTG